MKKKAFSLLELAVVFLVIAVITVGITKGAGMIKNARLASGRSITANSKISEVDGLVAWYETTLRESFKTDEVVDNDQTSAWYDISSQFSISEQKNALTRTADSKVVYRSDGINGLPSLQFSAAGRFSLADLYQGMYSSYSVFAVLSPTLSLSGVDMAFVDSYLGNNANSVAISSDGLDINSSTSTSLMATFEQSKEYVVGTYINNTESKVFVNDVTAADSDTNLQVNGFHGLTVGADRNGSNKFTGLLSELIIFNRVLSEKERIAVMSYLSKKYKIAVSGAM